MTEISQLGRRERRLVWLIALAGLLALPALSQTREMAPISRADVGGGVGTNSDAAQRGQSATNNLDNLPVEEQVRELIARLPEQTTALFMNPGGTDVVLPWSHSNRTPADRLVNIGYPAVPQLVEALTNSTPSRASKGMFITPELTVGDCALQILEAIAGRHFLGDSRYFSDSKQQDGVRKNIEAWWAEENSKGEKEMLINGVLALNGDSPAQATMLRERYPDIAAGIIIRALGTNSPVRGRLAEQLSPLDNPQVTAFWRQELTSGPSLNDRIRAAEALRAQGSDVVPEMIREWNKFPIQTPAGGTGVLVNFLASCDSISAIRVLYRDLNQRPDDMRCWVIRCVGEGSPKTASADAQNAVEQCLVSELEDTAERGYFSLGNMNVVYDARNCDIAAYFLAKRWPDRYRFDFSPGLSVRERERVECENAWRRAHRLKPLPLPLAPSKTVTPENANEVTSIEWATNSAKPGTNFLASVEEFRGKPLNAAKLVALLDHFGAKPETNASGARVKDYQGRKFDWSSCKNPTDSRHSANPGAELEFRQTDNTE